MFDVFAFALAFVCQFEFEFGQSKRLINEGQMVRCVFY